MNQLSVDEKTIYTNISGRNVVIRNIVPYNGAAWPCGYVETKRNGLLYNQDINSVNELISEFDITYTGMIDGQGDSWFIGIDEATFDNETFLSKYMNISMRLIKLAEYMNRNDL